MAKWNNEGETNVLNIYLKNQAQNTHLYLGLYENTTEPAEDATLASLTEQSGLGYARIILEPEDWSVSGDQGTQPQKTFTASGGAWGNQYGYFITNVATGTSGLLICCEHFSDGPYNVQDGGSVRVTPKITCV